MVLLLFHSAFSTTFIYTYVSLLFHGFLFTFLGDQCNLEIAYEHRLPRFPASLVVGPFGGVRGRDFLCVQFLDGTLFFYEQEVYAFSQLLRNRLLPEPIVYISRNDAFVTSNCSWILECYRHVLIHIHIHKYIGISRLRFQVTHLTMMGVHCLSLSFFFMCSSNSSTRHTRVHILGICLSPSLYSTKLLTIIYLLLDLSFVCK